MKKIIDHYNKTINEQEKLVREIKHKIHLLGTARLLLVGCMILFIWLFKSSVWWELMLLELCLVIPFVAMMVWHTKLFAKRQYTEALIRLCENEIKAINYDFSAFNGAPNKINAEHSFTLDLDIFGAQSIFQSINRTVIESGEEKLADWFIHPLQNKEQIEERQKSIEELGRMTDLRQHFYVVGSLKKYDRTNSSSAGFLSFPDLYFSKKNIWRILSWIVPCGWLLIIVSTIFLNLPISALGMYFAVTLGVAALGSKQINNLYTNVNKIGNTLSTYSRLMRIIENQNFESRLLNDVKNDLYNGPLVASLAIKKLSRLIGDMDNLYSLMGAVLNILILHNIRTALRLEKWTTDYAPHTSKWFDALATFDAFSSLGGFAYNHPDYIYPKIAKEYFEMKGINLGHPLLNRDKCVKNKIDIPHSSWFLIITGANMAGKSTYLRTVGVNFLLGCIGAPVCAEELTLFPAKLITSLRTSDSLNSNESYFFAELKRLKMIIDRLKKGEQLFIILDEILKGTNSIDKQKGSLALIKQLIGFNTCGIIATHDLMLGNLEDQFPKQIKNYRFEADIQGNELTFSYQMREGVAKNMNACFLMEKMGIVIDK